MIIICTIFRPTRFPRIHINYGNRKEKEEKTRRGLLMLTPCALIKDLI